MVTESEEFENNSNSKLFQSKTDKDDDFTKYNYLIISAMKKHKAEKVFLDEKATIEIMAALIYKNFLSNGSLGIGRQSGGYSLFWRIVSLISLLSFFCSLIGYDLRNGWAQKKEDAGNFDFKTGESLTSREFYGREEVLNDWSKSCLLTVEELNSKRTKKELEECSIYTRLNYALFGPPGTGKTFFVQAISKRLDRELKIKYLIHKKDSEYLKLKKDKSKKEELESFIKKQPSRIWYCEIQPADINSKYIGESEANTKKLFKEAREKIEGKEFVACILFFDEGDVFFNKRSGSSDPSTLAAANVKSELLRRIGIVSTEKYVPLFVFTATNRGDQFDPAFVRRFNFQSEFGLLDYQERIGFIRFLLDGFDVTEDEINTIATLTSNRLQSFIAEKMNLFMDRDFVAMKKNFT